MPMPPGCLRWPARSATLLRPLSNFFLQAAKTNGKIDAAVPTQLAIFRLPINDESQQIESFNWFSRFGNLVSIPFSADALELKFRRWHGM
jgi:hypothetical protein